MAVFEYTGVNERGQTFKKKIWAETLDNAKEALQREEIFFTEVCAKKNSGLGILTLEEKIHFFQELYQLLRAGIVLYEAIDLILNKMEGAKNQLLFLSIREALEKGKSFSFALEQSTGVFDNATIGIVRTAETSGQIIGAIKEILEMLKKKQALKKQIVEAIRYPVFLLGLALIILIVLLCFLVPNLKELFSEKNIPLITRAILRASDIFLEYGVYLISAFVLGIFGLRQLFKQKKIAVYFGEILFKIPVLAPFLKELLLARFCRTLYALTAANVPLVESLELCKSVMQNPFFLETIERALTLLHQGSSISKAFQDSPMISPLFCRMLETAEKSGELKTVLEQAGELYEQNVETDLKKLVGVLQPFLIIFIGLIVGLIMIGTLLPMTDIRSFMEAS